MTKEKNNQLTEGSHYIIRSSSTCEATIKTQGYFDGYMQLGNHQAITMELDDSHENSGKIRIIPCHMIDSIDIIKQEEPEEEEKKETSPYFG